MSRHWQYIIANESCKRNLRSYEQQFPMGMKISQIQVTQYEKGTVMERITYPGRGIWGLAGP